MALNTDKIYPPFSASNHESKMPIERCKQKIGPWEGVPRVRQTTCLILSYLPGGCLLENFWGTHLVEYSDMAGPRTHHPKCCISQTISINIKYDGGSIDHLQCCTA